MLNLFETYALIQSGIACLHKLAVKDWTVTGLIAAFALFSFLELQRPKMPFKSTQIVNAYRLNLSLFVLNSLLMSALSLTGLWLILEHFSTNGPLHELRKSFWKALTSFLLLDLLMYLWHRICHSFDTLWIFHKVHHSDPYMNASTAFRIHIIELAVTTFLKSAYIIALGIDKTVVIAYEMVYPLFVMFHHTNIAFPGEKWLGQFIVTPQLHRTHHSIERVVHDSNYGAIFSFWDRLFRTHQEVSPVALGIKRATPNTVWGLFKFGFFNPALPAQKPAPSPIFSVATNIHAMIAEAAYYKAEKRAFRPGHELCDWVEAKREIDKQLQRCCLNC